MAKRDLKVAWFNEGTNEFHTPRLRLAWPTLLEPKGIKNNPTSKPKFSTVALVPKGSDLAEWVKGMNAELVSKHGAKWKEKRLLLPIEKTADHPKLREYAEEYPTILKASANPDYPPALFGPDASRLSKDNAALIYGGRWAIITGTFYGYDNVAKGVNFGMNKVQLLQDAERIGGGRDTSNAGFEAMEEDDAELDAWDPAA